MKLAALALSVLAIAAQAETVSSIKNAEGGEIEFTDIKNEQCPTGMLVISYGMSGRTLFGCWAPGSIDYKIEDGVVTLVFNANVVWSTGQKNTYPIKRQRAQINSSTRKTQGAML